MTNHTGGRASAQGSSSRTRRDGDRRKRIDEPPQLIVDKDGKPRSTLANVLTLMRRMFGGTLAYDTRGDRVMTRQVMPWGKEPGPWSDHDDTMMTELIQHNGVLASVSTVAAAVLAVAHENRFDPVREYLEGLTWDRVPRIGKWLATYLSAEDTDYASAVGKRWLISCVARAIVPGCKADSALIFEGNQGEGKSTAFGTLGGPWFSDELAEIGTKDSALQLSGAWIIELSELDALTKARASTVKAFLSRRVDRFRPPYGRRVIEQPRSCVFCGTVNHSQYLEDETGGRRFWPVKVGRIDLAGLIADRDQLWAEAVDAYRAGERWYLDDINLIDAAKAEQQERLQRDPWHESIERFLAVPVRPETLVPLHANRDGIPTLAVPNGVNTADWIVYTPQGLIGEITIAHLLQGCIGKIVAMQTKYDAARVGRILCALGWQRKRLPRDQNRQGRPWVYVRPE